MFYYQLSYGTSLKINKVTLTAHDDGNASHDASQTAALAEWWHGMQRMPTETAAVGNHPLVPPSPDLASSKPHHLLHFKFYLYLPLASSGTLHSSKLQPLGVIKSILFLIIPWLSQLGHDVNVFVLKVD